MILEELGRNPSDVTLDYIVKDLLSFFNGFEYLHKAKRMIEERCAIEREPEHKCWPEDKIKQAWKETIKEDIKSSRRKDWAHVIMLQVVKTFVCDTCKQNTAQKNRHATTDEPGYATRPNPEDGSDQSNQQTTNSNQSQTGGGSQGQTGTPSQSKRRFCESYPGDLDDQSGMDGSEASDTDTGIKRRRDKTIYIRIPLSKMFGNKANSTKKETNLNSQYKLIDSPPEKSKKETDEETEIKKNGFYVMLFNKEKNHAEWVYEILNKKTVPLHYKTPAFKEDRKDPNFQDPNERNPDYDRGHLAAAANHRWCEKAFEATYWMSNITPQNKNLNRGAWKQLEIYCRDKILSKNVHNVHVYTGPLYLKKSDEENLWMPQSSETDSEDWEALPTHYFKVLIVENKDGTVRELECFYIPNAEGQTCIPAEITEIERLSGLTFTDSSPKLTQVDYTKTTTWTGNKGETSVKIDVSISSYEKNDGNPQGLNEE